jgi:hypothetical protein
MIPEVYICLPGGQSVGAHICQAQHGLQLSAVALAQRCKAQFAGAAQKNNPTGHGYVFARDRVRRQPDVRVADFLQGSGTRDCDGIWVRPGSQHPLPLMPAYTHLVRQVVVGTHANNLVIPCTHVYCRYRRKS